EFEENLMENEPQDAYIPGSEDAHQPFDVREQSGRSGMIKLIGVAVFLLLLALLVLKLFASGTRDRDQTPRILADNAPYKVVPVERGGAQTPNQDKEIYEVLNGTNTETIVKTVPITEEPLPKPRPVTKPSSKPAANVVIKEPATTLPPTPNTVTTRPSVANPKTVTGNYVVQVASLRSRAEADALWRKLSGKMGNILTSAHFADIKRVDLNERGIYYRLRVSGLPSKTAANQMCQKLKAAKQDCIVTLR
ncbi:MAG: SPOR domain-containing protein, partial [Robiginitomaculum sp.]|nr:SPOR domain-containing protein [Robiginitomaculum sp.]